MLLFKQQPDGGELRDQQQLGAWRRGDILHQQQPNDRRVRYQEQRGNRPRWWHLLLRQQPGDHEMHSQ